MIFNNLELAEKIIKKNYKKFLNRIIQTSPRLICLVVYGQNVNAGTTMMSGAVSLSNYIKKVGIDIPIAYIGSHVQALPYETLNNEKSIDIVLCNEGVYALRNLLSVDIENANKNDLFKWRQYDSEIKHDDGTVWEWAVRKKAISAPKQSKISLKDDLLQAKITTIATSDGNEKVRCFNDAKITFETGGSEQMRLDSAGHLLINATAQTVGASCAIKNDTTETTLEIVNVSTSGAHRCVDFRNGDGDLGGSININTGSDSVSFETSSDYRLKENVVDLTGAITRIKNLKPKRFNFKKDTDTTLDGFLAHEAQAVVPQAVSGVKDGTETRKNIVINNKGNVIACDITEAEWTKRKSDGEFANDTEWFASKEFMVKQGIDQSKLVPLLTAALQEAITKIETLETKVKALEEA